MKTVAVKTGTTDNSRDAWTIGYTPNLVVGVWVGNNDNAAMLSGGSDMAGPIWRSIMKTAIGKTSPGFSQPSGIVEETICTTIGTFKDVFLSSAVPGNKCSAYTAPTVIKQPEKQPDTTITPKETTPTTPNDVPPTTGTGTGSGDAAPPIVPITTKH